MNSIERNKDDPEVVSTNVTFAFGHVVGAGIQDVLAGFSFEQVLFRMYLGWHTDLYDSNDKQNKSFWTAVFAIQKFIALRKQGLLDGYELLTYDNKPACELSFRITFPDGFKLRGFVDAVLRHKITGKILVLELKTTSAKYVDEAMYKNSAQAIGYSIVLDVIAPEINSYEVLYLIYLTGQMDYEVMPFEKSYFQRVLWIRELLLDIETIKMYEEAQVFPMRGENCIKWGRRCDYFGLCTLSDEHVIKPQVEVPNPVVEDYQIELTLAQVIQAQQAKLIEG